MLINPEEVGELVDRVVHINRVAKVVKGGRRFSFSALVVVGDQNRHVGTGLAKGNDVPEVIRKGTDRAKRNLFKVPLVKGTIPHEIEGHFGAAYVLLRPASPGTGVIAGGGIDRVYRVPEGERALEEDRGRQGGGNHGGGPRAGSQDRDGGLRPGRVSVPRAHQGPGDRCPG